MERVEVPSFEGDDRSGEDRGRTGTNQLCVQEPLALGSSYQTAIEMGGNAVVYPQQVPEGDMWSARVVVTRVPQASEIRRVLLDDVFDDRERLVQGTFLQAWVRIARSADTLTLFGPGALPSQGTQRVMIGNSNRLCRARRCLSAMRRDHGWWVRGRS